MIKESENNRISMEDAHRLSDSNFSEENSDLESSVSKLAYQVMSQLSNEVVNDDLSSRFASEKEESDFEEEIDFETSSESN